LEITPNTPEVAVCCSRASASSRVRASSCFFNSISELGPSLTCALAFVPVERGLRSRAGLFAPLRDKVTSSAQSLVPLPVGPAKGQPPPTNPNRTALNSRRLTRSARRCYSRNGTLWNASLGLLRLDPGELHDLAPLFRFIRDHFSEISRRHRCRHAAKLAETRFHLGIG